MPAKHRFCGLRTVYQSGRSDRRSRGSGRPLFSTVLRRFSSLDRRGDRGGLAQIAPAVGDTGAGTGCRSPIGPASGPGAKRTVATPSRAAISCPRWASSKAQTESARVDVERAVARDPGGPRVPRDPLADGVRPALDERRRGPPEGPKRAELAPDRVRQPFQGSPPRLARLDRKQGRVRRGDHGLAEPRDRGRPEPRGGAGRAPRGRRREAGAAAARAARPRPGGARARRAAARPASRSREARGRPRSTRSSRCGPRPVVPRVTSASRRTSSASTDGRVAIVGEPPAREPEARRGAPGTPARAPPRSRGVPRPALPRVRRRARVHGETTSRGGEAELHAAERCVPLRESRRVVLRETAPARVRAVPARDRGRHAALRARP